MLHLCVCDLGYNSMQAFGLPSGPVPATATHTGSSVVGCLSCLDELNSNTEHTLEGRGCQRERSITSSSGVFGSCGDGCRQKTTSGHTATRAIAHRHTGERSKKTRMRTHGALRTPSFLLPPLVLTLGEVFASPSTCPTAHVGLIGGDGFGLPLPSCACFQARLTTLLHAPDCMRRRIRPAAPPLR